MARIEPELWVDRAREAVAFYAEAFAAEVVLLVGEGDDLVARLRTGDARFWVASADAARHRLSPPGAGGATGRLLLVVDDPEAVVDRAVRAGARLASPVAQEHGWRVGRVVDPYGHEWEVGAED